ncbi:MAG: extracellular solute-binding protein [Caldilineales bacterium]|nr:extracellular solute-binding protein [Caldilineales bacterium]
MKNKLLSIIVLLVIASMILTACGGSPAAPAATTAPEQAQAPAATEAPASAAPVTLSILTSPNPNDSVLTDALMAAYTAEHPNVTFEVETLAATSDTDNLIRTRLASGEMNDIFYYNSGSLLKAMNPANTLVDLSQEPFMADIADSFKPTVSQGDGIFGVPAGFVSAMGILYNKRVYENLGLSVPMTWAEFEANNEKIKAAGLVPVAQTYGDPWSSQILMLGDYCNIEQANPNFADDYTNNKAKFATTPAALAGFTYLQEGFEKGWWPADFTTLKFDAGLKMLVDGQAAHFPMVTQILPVIAGNWPDKLNDIGFFAQPGTDAAKNILTVGMPLAFYIPKTSKNIEEAKKFLAFVASTAGADAITAKTQPAGPYLIKGATLPATVPPVVQDMNAYINAGKACPALEFLSPVKGPTLPQITVSVGSGQMTAEEGAAAYDKDVEKQAQQLGLPGW